MNKITLTLLISFQISTSFAEETLPNLGKGKWSIETNLSSFFSNNGTGFFYSKAKNSQTWGIGGEAGYFIIDKLAIKLGAGYSSNKVDINVLNLFEYQLGLKSIHYKVGAKYYLINTIPLQIDFGGLKGIRGVSNYKFKTVIGAQAGYAWMVKKNFIIEPQIRYDIIPKKDNQSQEKIFTARVGFSFIL